ncbi:hypothetical protein [Paradevosia shaoguanensis]|uniref:Uncharacterized protein n=1 Tax=Paradevosia shaoguanensis TaxID=1335043 RepID=A0AA41QJ15_9HYPH|nr:hypothetical protein [Paradevosia shaoguanensis]MCF1741254.1 hypothetical protein [Paradevosia shaoguanensis]MCI0125737.1 hypothetical protein [Paradevosia shaoguanensis]
MTTITFNSVDEAIQYAFSEIKKLTEVSVELRGQIEAHRYATHALALCLQETSGFSPEVLSAAFAKTSQIVRDATAKYEDPTSKLQYGEVLKELDRLAKQMASPRPTFTVIEGGKA